MKTRLFLVFAALALIGGCKKSSSGSSASSAGGFTSNVNAIASTQPENTEPGSLDNVPADAPDTTEPATVS